MFLLILSYHEYKQIIRLMKKVIFTNKKTNAVTDCRIGNIGELVFAITHNVNEMNDAIRWCNKHHVGDVFNSDNYTIKLVESLDETSNAKEEIEKAELVKVELSPMLKQFYELKAKRPDAILLFRCGDFYETYSDDAIDTSSILGITLTTSTKIKDKDDKPLKMAGFPYHALDTYLPKLIRAGKRVAICDQLEYPNVKKHIENDKKDA